MKTQEIKQETGLVSISATELIPVNDDNTRFTGQLTAEEYAEQLIGVETIDYTFEYWGFSQTIASFKTDYVKKAEKAYIDAKSRGDKESMTEAVEKIRVFKRRLKYVEVFEGEKVDNNRKPIFEAGVAVMEDKVKFYDEHTGKFVVMSQALLVSSIKNSMATLKRTLTELNKDNPDFDVNKIDFKGRVAFIIEFLGEERKKTGTGTYHNFRVEIAK